MATLLKVRRLLEVSNATEQLRKIAQQMCEGIKANHEKARDVSGALGVDIVNELFTFISSKLDAMVISIYQDLFTEEELDELIAIHSLPLYQKMRDLLPEITNRVVSFVNENQEAIDNEAERLFS